MQIVSQKIFDRLDRRLIELNAPSRFIEFEYLDIWRLDRVSWLNGFSPRSEYISAMAFLDQLGMITQNLDVYCFHFPENSRTFLQLRGDVMTNILEAFLSFKYAIENDPRYLS